MELLFAIWAFCTNIPDPKMTPPGCGQHPFGMPLLRHNGVRDRGSGKPVDVDLEVTLRRMPSETDAAAPAPNNRKPVES